MHAIKQFLNFERPYIYIGILLVCISILIPLGQSTFKTTNVEAANVIPNPGCDSDTSSLNGYQGTLSRVTSPVHSGAGACKMVYSTGTYFSLTPITSIPNPPQGAVYSGSAWAIAGSSASIGQSFYVSIREKGGASPNHSAYGPAVKLSNTWQLATNTYTIQSSGRTSVDFYVVEEDAGVSGQSYIADDMFFNAGSNPLPISPTPPPPTPPPGGYSTITLRGTNSGNNGTGSTTLTLNKPVGTAAGDVLVAQVNARGASATTITPPTGWTLIRRDDSSTSVAVAVYFHVSGTTEPSAYTWTFNAAQEASGGIAGYVNVDNTSPIDDNSGAYNGSTTVMTGNPVTASTSQDKLLFFGAVVYNATVTPPSGFTSLWNTTTNLTTSFLADKTLTQAGSTGSVTGSHSAAGKSNIVQMVALKPSFASPTLAPTPLPQNVSNLNFYLSNFDPWVQITCGDYRMDNGVQNPVSNGQSMMVTNANCSTPGVIYTGDSTANFGAGSSSSTNQVVGGYTYAEVYKPSSGAIVTSYATLAAKANTADTPPTSLASVCTLSNCTLPANLPQGVYVSSNDVSLNAYTFPVNKNYVFLIDGNLTLNGDVLTPVSSSSLFSTSGNIVVPATEGSAPSATAPDLSGIFSADNSFIMQSTGSCSDLRLNIEGTLVVNAAQKGGSFQNKRDLCGNNIANPSLEIVQRLDYVTNLPDFIRSLTTTSNEVAP